MIRTQDTGWAKAWIAELDEFDTNYRLRLQIPDCAQQSAEGLKEVVATTKLALMAWLTSDEKGCKPEDVWLEVHMDEPSFLDDEPLDPKEADIYISPSAFIYAEPLYKILLAWFTCANLKSAVSFQLHERGYGEMDFEPCSSVVAEYSPTNSE